MTTHYREPPRDDEHLGQPPGAEIEERFSDPGLPAHVYRTTDTDPKAARRAERQVTALFTLSVIGTIVFVVGFLAFQVGHGATRDWQLSNIVMGTGLGLAIFCVGAGAIHWAKKLMPDDEVVEMRHTIRSTDEERAAAAGIITEGGEGAGFGRRRMIWASLTGALGALAIPAVLPLANLGPKPREALAHTFWAPGIRLVRDPDGTPIKAADLPIGGLLHVLPEGIEKAEDVLAEQAKAVTLLIRLAPTDVTPQATRKGFDYAGIVAYSQLCTHVGCPVALYEQQTHHLLCPCHQSTFDVLQNCKVIFGPAARALPQLPITVDEAGYLVAKDDYDEPVGPSFWERG